MRTFPKWQPDADQSPCQPRLDHRYTTSAPSPLPTSSPIPRRRAGKVVRGSEREGGRIKTVLSHTPLSVSPETNRLLEADSVDKKKRRLISEALGEAVIDSLRPTVMWRQFCETLTELQASEHKAEKTKYVDSSISIQHFWSTIADSVGLHFL